MFLISDRRSRPKLFYSKIFLLKNFWTRKFSDLLYIPIHALIQCMNACIYICMYECLYITACNLKGVANLLSPWVNFESGTDFIDFLVRQSIVPSAMLVKANKMAATRDTIVTIIHISILSASCSEVEEVVRTTELFAILRKIQPYCHAINDTKKR